MKYALVNLPVLGSKIQRLYKKIDRQRGFIGSYQYWNNRYEVGENSGPGSYSKLAQFKAESINTFVSEKSVETILELGCGDGNQLLYAEYPDYVGFDISPRAIKICKKKYKNDKSKRFYVLNSEEGVSLQARLTLSLDVIFHLVEDITFETYMEYLFDASKKFVCIYSSNTDEQGSQIASHVRHRNFSKWVSKNRPEWHLLKEVGNPYPYNGNDEETSFANFYFYELA